MFGYMLCAIVGFIIGGMFGFIICALLATLRDDDNDMKGGGE